ncbi:MAG: SufD family Fe-S cluster assembly protein [Nanoarchaeota archaeon]|nr:SufD family Fe-S cluster assembly protein [Nanoarchaeota archaeon]
MNYEDEFKQFVNAYEKSGYVSNNLFSPKYAKLIVNESKVLSKGEVEGVSIKTRFKNGTLYAKITIKKGVKVKYPIHMCFGVLKEKWNQKIHTTLILEEGAEAKMISHCFFPNSKNVFHIMKGNFILKNNSKLIYEEEHFHGKNGAIVKPHVKIKVGKNSFYVSTFKAKRGVIGKLDINYKLDVGEKGVAELYTKVFGRKKDKIKIYEEVNLKGNNSRGILQSRVAATENSQCNVKSVMRGLGNYSRGHVDCTEIIEENGVVSAIPIVEVKNKTAHITHEASLGRVNKKQVDTLMTKGLTEEEAVEIIIRGLLR